MVIAKAMPLEGLLNTNELELCCRGKCTVFGNKTTFVTDRVVLDGNILTSRGPGTAMEFSLKIVEILTDARMSDKLAEVMFARL